MITMDSKLQTTFYYESAKTVTISSFGLEALFRPQSRPGPQASDPSLPPIPCGLPRMDAQPWF
jgi:hypothetical protein